MSSSCFFHLFRFLFLLFFCLFLPLLVKLPFLLSDRDRHREKLALFNSSTRDKRYLSLFLSLSHPFQTGLFYHPLTIQIYALSYSLYHLLRLQTQALSSTHARSRHKRSFSTFTANYRSRHRHRRPLPPTPAPDIGERARAFYFPIPQKIQAFFFSRFKIHCCSRHKNFLALYRPYHIPALSASFSRRRLPRPPLPRNTGSRAFPPQTQALSPLSPSLSGKHTSALDTSSITLSTTYFGSRHRRSLFLPCTPDTGPQSFCNPLQTSAFSVNLSRHRLSQPHFPSRHSLSRAVSLS
ncbi:unnamed protein product [Acanthosepion pharaonis]|uniref:Uncharacterized protein n=1 Tax=Acanthosepion pharaonis TaxID=158019 RepID=A0A812E5U9_ACAPH|nr:unnamed protein product [Sepia pharaonis]